MTHGTSPALARVTPVLAREIGQALREARLAQGLRQGELSQLSGIGRTTASKIEGGHECPTLPMVVVLTYALGVPPGELVARIVDLPAIQAVLQASVSRRGAP